MQKAMRHNITILAWFLAVLAIIVVSVIWITRFSNETQAAPGETDGEAIIRSMEAVPIAPIEDHIFQKEKDEILRKILDDPDRTFQTLADINTVILGDSRVVGFSMYGFMDPSRILAGTSWSIQEIPALYGIIEQMNPRFVIVSFGVNEIGQQYFTPVYYSTDESYIADLKIYMDTIQSIVPDARIYFSAILPVSDWGLESKPGFAIIPERNQAIKQFCEESGYGFIDTEHLTYEHPDLYIADGVHFYAEFYPYWGRDILEQIIADGGIS